MSKFNFLRGVLTNKSNFQQNKCKNLLQFSAENTFAWWDWGELQINSIRIASLDTKNQIWDFPETGVIMTRYINFCIYVYCLLSFWNLILQCLFLKFSWNWTLWSLWWVSVLTNQSGLYLWLIVMQKIVEYLLDYDR